MNKIEMIFVESFYKYRAKTSDINKELGIDELSSEHNVGYIYMDEYFISQISNLKFYTKIDGVEYRSSRLKVLEFILLQHILKEQLKN